MNDLFLTAIFMGIGLYLWLFAYRRYRIDLFRFHIFVVRDALFDYAIGRPYLYGTDAYKNLRRAMNGSIRYAETMSIWYVLYLTILSSWFGVLKYPVDGFIKQFENDLSGLVNDEDKIVLRSYHQQFQNLIFVHIIYRSLPLFLFCELLILMSGVVSKMKNLKEDLQYKFQDRLRVREMETHSFMIG